MRIVAGTARGRTIVTPAGEEVRPTSARVREAIFNSLHSHGLVEDAVVLDLFAGSGALGLEALSRGARHVTFVDTSRRSLDVVRHNVEALGFGERSTVRLADALGLATERHDRYDLALLDPPYAFDAWSELLERLDAGAIVVESDRPVELGARWRIIKEKQYAGTVVQIAVADSDEDDDDAVGPAATQEANRA